MGIIKQGILGGFSGKVANVVGSSWKGIAVMKSLPLSVANPRTAPQIAQRTKFSNTVAFAVSILSGFIKPLWDRFAQQQSGFNAFISANVDLFENEVPSPLEDLQLSRGKMLKTNPTQVFVTGIGPAGQVSFDNTLEGNLQQTTDKAFVVVYNATKEEWGYGSESAFGTRDDGAKDFETNSVWDVGDTVHAYLSFLREDGTVVSNTGYYTGATISM